MLYLGMQFVYVIGHREQQDFRGNFLVSSKEKLTKAVILLYDPKSSFGLYGAVHPQLDSVRTGNPFQGCGTLYKEFL